MVVISISFLHMPSNPECSLVLQFHHRHANKASNFLAFKALKIQMPDANFSKTSACTSLTVKPWPNNNNSG